MLRLHSRNQRSPVAVFAHEFGHTLSGGFTFDGSIRGEVSNMQYTNNRYEWWMGMRRTNSYLWAGWVDRDAFDFRFKDLNIPYRSLLEGVIRPGF